MSTTTTSNIKISQLDELGEIGDGAKLRILASKDKSATSTPDWESYSVNGEVLSYFIKNNIGVNNLESNLNNLQTYVGEESKKISSLQSDLQVHGSNMSNLATKINSVKDDYDELEKRLGKYNLVTNITLNVSEANKYISQSGEKKSLNNFSISNTVSLKQGNLYLLKSNSSFPADIAFMAKVDTHTYTLPSGTSGTEIVYEPLPTHYHSTSNGGYGTPESGYFVFFATEDKDVVISTSSERFNNDNVLHAIKYGMFIEIADNLLSINGELMKVIVEAIVKNKKDIDSLYERTKSLGDIHVTSIDSDEFPCVQGEPMVVVADRRPGPETATHGADVPNRIGQIWVKTNEDDGGKQAFIAVSLGSTSGWKQITV